MNEDITSQIESQAARRGLKVAGKVRYDPAVTEAQIKKLSVVEYSHNGIAGDIKHLWVNVQTSLNTAGKEQGQIDK